MKLPTAFLRVVLVDQKNNEFVELGGSPAMDDASARAVFDSIEESNQSDGDALLLDLYSEEYSLEDDKLIDRQKAEELLECPLDLLIARARGKA